MTFIYHSSWHHCTHAFKHTYTRVNKAAETSDYLNIAGDVGDGSDGGASESSEGQSESGEDGDLIDNCHGSPLSLISSSTASANLSLRPSAEQYTNRNISDLKLQRSQSYVSNMYSILY